MEDLPLEILSTFPLIIRRVSRTFRDAISIFDHWIKLGDQKNIDFLLSHRRYVKYFICKGLDVSWAFPNIQWLKIDHNFEQRPYPLDLTKYCNLKKNICRSNNWYPDFTSRKNYNQYAFLQRY
jgi:hypothetical protein